MAKKTLFDEQSLDSRLSTIMAEIGYIRGGVSDMRQSQIRLEDKFDKLEEGRLTVVETTVAKIEAVRKSEKDHAKAAATWISLIIATITVVINLIISLLLRR